jgi:hypothetical protein
MRCELIRIGLALTLGLVLSGCKKREQPPARAVERPSPAQTSSPLAEPITRVASNVPLPTPEPGPTNSPAGVAETNGPVLLKVNWPVGHRYVYRMDLDQHSTNQVAQGPEPRTEDLAVGLTYTVEVVSGSDPNGGRELELEFLADEIQSKMADRVLAVFDSSSDPGTDKHNLIAGPFRRVIHSKLRLQLTPAGRVEKVVGLDQWTATVVGQDSEAGGHMVSQLFNEGFFRQLADFGQGIPAEPVAVGQSWPYHTELPAGALGKIDVQSTITFKRREQNDDRKLALLSTQGTLTGLPKNPSDAQSTMALDHGTVTGFSWFDLDSGVLVESEVTQFMRLKGEMSGLADGSRPAMSFTSDIGQQVTVKLVEAENRKK